MLQWYGDSDDDVPLGILLARSSQSSDVADCGDGSGGRSDDDNSGAGAGRHVDVESGGDESDASVGSDEEEHQQQQPIELLVRPGVIEAGQRNTFSHASGRHRLVFGPARQSFFSATGPAEVKWANLRVNKLTFDHKLVRQLSGLPPPVLKDACYLPNIDVDFPEATSRRRRKVGLRRVDVDFPEPTSRRPSRVDQRRFDVDLPISTSSRRILLEPKSNRRRLSRTYVAST